MSAFSSSPIAAAHHRRFGLLVCCLIVFAVGFLLAQNASTGALVGTASDPTGAVLPGAKITVTSEFTQEARSVSTQADGDYALPLLPPGLYTIKFEKAGFRATVYKGIKIEVTETTRVDAQLTVGQVSDEISVTSHPSDLQTENSALGRVVNDAAVSALPLVSRNFTQIAGLSPGVLTGVTNAGELGLGGGGLSQIGNSTDGLFVHGSRSYNNEFQMDGTSVSDVQGVGSASGGVPIPNPDAIQEFKVQTGLYDASYGRYAGANISIVTKAGTSEYHASLFEFFRNDVLNANDYFRNLAGQPRPVLKQNQFGFTLGGPIRRDRMFLFGSYQGTHQTNGLASGQARTSCSATLNTPPLTDDRSPAALGQLFGGMAGAQGGVTINPDGSNINPAALALLNFKLRDGTFLIPTPQTVDATQSFQRQGFSAFSEPCHFEENQFLTNADIIASEKDRVTARFFYADDDQEVTFPGNGLNPTGNIRGFNSPGLSRFRVFSLAHTHVFNSHWLNEMRISYLYTRTSTEAPSPFKWSDVGVEEGAMNRENELPSLIIPGSISIASAFPRTYPQSTFAASDTMSFVRGVHSVRWGGWLARIRNDRDTEGLGSLLSFLSWPDFLLGLDATQNGTGRVSNVFTSVDAFGLLGRQWMAWEGAAFVQDDIRLRKSLTLNLGLRYERMGLLGDASGRNSGFDISLADHNPPAGGSVAGYVVASNFPGPVPPGVTRASNEFATNGRRQNSLAPRVGFAWRVFPEFSGFVLRGGYGMYFSRPTGVAFGQGGLSAPFALPRQTSGAANADATFEHPFAEPFPTDASFPSFPAYSPTTILTQVTPSPDFGPALIQQFGLNTQAELRGNWLLEVGYVGNRGTHLQRTRSWNQALSASAARPVRGEATNTLANIPLRVPVPGITPSSLIVVETAGNSWYNGLEASLSKRLGNRLQLLASYTFSKTLDTDGAEINGISAGNTSTSGDQNSPRQRWGRPSFDRSQRFVFSATYSLPNPARAGMRLVLGGWALAGVVTIQSGTALTVTYTNPTNVFGIIRDRAQIAASCTKEQLIVQGRAQANLKHYFNSACFTTPTVIGEDGVGTGFGNSGTGIVNGPGQANIDLAISKGVPLVRLRGTARLEFRGEFFNALNHPQFANPDANLGSAGFGSITNTAVNPRVGQLALKFSF